MTDPPLRPYAGRRVLLGVTGGIASYKTAWLARLLAKAGAEVDVVMTRAATEFVGAITFEALTGRARAHGPVRRRAARSITSSSRVQRDAIVVAPATADFMARAATGQADDLLTACLLATEAPVLLVPAMNDRMWAHAQTQANVAHLRELGYRLLDPGRRRARRGRGKRTRADARAGDDLRARRPAARGAQRARAGARCSSPPARRARRSIRCASSPITAAGRMGVAIAAAAWRRGADVDARSPDRSPCRCRWA